MTRDEALERIRCEYIEMPDLKLTVAQVRRLCDLPEAACGSAIDALIVSGFLRQASDGRYFRTPNTASR